MKIIEQFLHPDIEKYATEHTTAEDSVLENIHREAHVKMLRPRMLSGSYQGKLLEILSCMIRANRILEIGTYVGYSAICMAKGLTQNGLLYTIEVDEELEDVILKNIESAQMQNQIKLYIGNALDIIPNLNETFDLVFIDADKINYINYYELALEKTKNGGILLADNILWSGKVLYKQPEGDKETAILKAFNQHVKNDKRVQNILLPIRDGIMLIQKL